MIEDASLKPEEQRWKCIEEEGWTIKYADGAHNANLYDEFKIMRRNFLLFLLDFNFLSK